MDDIREVYNKISNDFDDTRYRVWTCTSRFMDPLEKGLNGLEVGCGNGKNILYRKDDLNIKGIDICDKLVDICKKKNLDVIQGNMTSLPYSDESFDFVYCIAVLHHLKTKEERIQALNEIFRVCKKGGKIFVLVWAFEQEENSKRKFKTQDELVSWKSREDGNTYYRFYHLYKKSELEDEFDNTNYSYTSYESLYELGNWGIMCVKN
jgi:tRNA (uracil-5-)-methyltransferase TRM9